MAPILVDTNLLVYCYDRREPAKQERAVAVVSALGERGQGRLSVQNLAEFFRVTTSGSNPIFTLTQAEERTIAYLGSWTVLEVTPSVIREAMAGVRRHRFNYWDAQIWAVARLNQIEIVFSEDFASGAKSDGVYFVNPLAANFKLAPWLA